MAYQRRNHVIVVVCDESNLISLPENVLNLFKAAIEHDPRLAALLDLLEEGSIIVAEGVELPQRDLDAVEAFGVLDHLLDADQTLLVLENHHQGLPAKLVNQVCVSLEKYVRFAPGFNVRKKNL